MFAVERFAEEQIEKLEMLNEELTTEKEKLSDDNRYMYMYKIYVKINNNYCHVFHCCCSIVSLYYLL